ncbi:MAG: hypothetical protein LW636_02675 [Planctomycetaceae bacterium]|nr:hypothetical protein [Planctomycetaceae bacterium]
MPPHQPRCQPTPSKFEQLTDAADLDRVQQGRVFARYAQRLDRKRCECLTLLARHDDGDTVCMPRDGDRAADGRRSADAGKEAATHEYIAHPHGQHALAAVQAAEDRLASCELPHEPEEPRRIQTKLLRLRRDAVAANDADPWNPTLEAMGHAYQRRLGPQRPLIDGDHARCRGKHAAAAATTIMELAAASGYPVTGDAGACVGGHAVFDGPPLKRSVGTSRFRLDHAHAGLDAMCHGAAAGLQHPP